MEKIITQLYVATDGAIVNEGKKSRKLIDRFRDFCEQQQENRLGWTAFTLTVQACVLVPMTLIVVHYNGNPFVLWTPVILFFVVTEFCVLAALPTRILIPLFCTSVLVNVSVIILSFLL